MARFDRGDYIKVEFDSEVKGLPSEWMWVKVDRCDEERQLAFGRLDNEPVVNATDLQLGDELVMSFDKVREHCKPWQFQTRRTSGQGARR